MSIEALNWAFTLPLDSPSDKAVLIGLANHANPGGQAWPAVERLALYTGLTGRAVRLALRRLEEQGLVATQHREGTSNCYQLALPGAGGRNEVPPTPERGSGGEERGSSKPSRTTTEPLSREARAPLPAEWWPPADEIEAARRKFPLIAEVIDHETHKFVAHSEETGRTHARPVAAWRRWIANAAIFAARSNVARGPGSRARPDLSARNAATVERVLGALADRADVVEPEELEPRRAGSGAR